MKIMIVNTLYYPNRVGGAERSVQQLAESLTELGHETLVLSTGNGDDHIDHISGVKVYYLNHRNLYWGMDSKKRTTMQKLVWHSKDIYNWSMKLKLQEIIEHEKPDIIHSNNLSGFSVAPWLIAKQKGIPVLHTLRDYYLMCPQSTKFKNGTNCSRPCASCSVFSEYKKHLTNRGYVQHVVGISQFIRDHHKQHGFFKDTESSVIFNGAPISRLPVENKAGDRDGLVFLYLGRVEEAKGVKHLLDVFSEINQVQIWLGGKIHDPAIQSEYEAGKYPGNIKFLGYINPDDVFPEVDALILPSLWNEPFGRVVFEAYAHGVPVIGANRGGIPEIIHNGETGYVYDPEQREQLKEILLSFINNPNKLRKLANNCRNYLQEHSLDKTSRQYIRIYHNLLSRNISNTTRIK